jgi:hypothetical protein
MIKLTFNGLEFKDAITYKFYENALEVEVGSFLFNDGSIFDFLKKEKYHVIIHTDDGQCNLFFCTNLEAVRIDKKSYTNGYNHVIKFIPIE